MKIDINKKYRYRSGEPARILTVTRSDKYQQFDSPVLSESVEGRTFYHHADGKSFYTDAYDLIEVREPREFTIWIHPNGGTQRHEPLCTGWEGPIRTLEIID